MAQKLGRTVEELRGSLTQDEFVMWSRFYARKAQRQEMAEKGG